MKQLNNTCTEQSRSIYLQPQKHESIVPIVERHFGLAEKDLYRRTRKREIAEARQVAIWIEYCENMEEYKHPCLRKIAAQYPGKKKIKMHHSNILSAVKTVNNLMEVEQEFRLKIYRLQLQLFGKVKYLKAKFFKDERH